MLLHFLLLSKYWCHCQASCLTATFRWCSGGYTTSFKVFRMPLPVWFSRYIKLMTSTLSFAYFKDCLSPTVSQTGLSCHPWLSFCLTLHPNHFFFWLIHSDFTFPGLCSVHQRLFPCFWSGFKCSPLPWTVFNALINVDIACLLQRSQERCLSTNTPLWTAGTAWGRLGAAEERGESEERRVVDWICFRRYSRHLLRGA